MSRVHTTGSDSPTDNIISKSRVDNEMDSQMSEPDESPQAVRPRRALVNSTDEDSDEYQVNPIEEVLDSDEEQSVHTDSGLEESAQRKGGKRKQRRVHGGEKKEVKTKVSHVFSLS